MALNRKLYRSLFDDSLYQKYRLWITEGDHPLRETSACVEDAFIIHDDINKIKEELYYESNQIAVSRRRDYEKKEG